LKKLLIISPQFAPVNSADSHRVRHMLPYLNDNGWHAEVLTVRLDRLEKPVLDNLLLDTIPINTILHYVSAFDYKLTRRFGLGSLSIRSFCHYYIFLNRILKKKKIDLIFFSTTSFHLLALGPLMKRKYKIPYVLDIQDPWRSDFYLDKPKNERPPKFLLNYYIDKYLEAYSIPNADGIISVSKDYLQTFDLRYNFLSKNQLVVPFSASLFDFFPSQGKSKILKTQDGHKNIVYVGRGGYDLYFTISCFFKAIKKIESYNNLNSNRLIISFIGTSYAPQGEGVKTIKPLSENLDLDSQVFEQTDRVGYFEAISIIQNADILFIPGSIDPAYTASKIYPYILANKPIIACFHEKSSVVEILNKCTKTNVITFNSESNKDQVINKLFSELKRVLQIINLEEWDHDELAMKSYMAPEMTKKICGVFTSAING